MKKKMNPSGFTLVEIIVVLVILAILAAVLVPVLTGFIEKAKENTAITECESCVKAAQALSSEGYAENSENTTIDLPKAMKLAEVEGVGTITKAEILHGGVEHLTYVNDKYIVEYCRKSGCTQCGNTETYTVTKKTTKGLQEMTDSTFINLVTALKADGHFSKRVDGINSNTSGTVAYRVYQSLSKEEQQFLDSVSWSYVKASDGWRIYFTESHYGATESAENIKVYKYNPDTGQYQYSESGTKIDSGKVSANGKNWSDWSNTIE